MAKVTSKLQVTVPKAIADRYKIKAGDEIEWSPAGDGIRVTPRVRRPSVGDRAARLRVFDQATERQRCREPASRRAKPAKERGWTREELYDRGRAG
ncbi:MAG: AbrB/MazE/SpoVT family DNA-binding domain-containing protein [Myxococcales bacterium]|nr:AbrB/MazE/SpoVT family DNA-binding domain-containing protein [Myxococcales bacterium]